jgi:hypothetical protein
MYHDLIHRCIYKFRKYIDDPKDIREHFIFKWDKSLETREVKRYDERVQDVEVQ